MTLKVALIHKLRCSAYALFKLVCNVCIASCFISNFATTELQMFVISKYHKVISILLYVPFKFHTCVTRSRNKKYQRTWEYRVDYDLNNLKKCV